MYGALEEEKPVDDDDVENVGKTNLPEICGHQWHVAEIIFLVLGLAGLIFFFVSIIGVDITTAIGAIALLAAAILGTFYVWNLAQLKRLAHNTEELRENIIRQKEITNERNQTAEEMRNNIEKMKKAMDKMENSMDLLGEDIKNFEQVDAKFRELNEQSKVLQEERQKLLENHENLILENTKNRLKERLLEKFEAADEGGNAVASTPEQKAGVRKILDEYKIDWDFEECDQDGDGVIDYFEFEEGLDKIIDVHFAKLQQLMKENTALRDRLKSYPASP